MHQKKLVAARAIDGKCKNCTYLKETNNEETI
jgi:hypothetical protein